MTTRMSCPRAASALGNEPHTSARPPVLTKGATSALRERIFRGCKRGLHSGAQKLLFARLFRAPVGVHRSGTVPVRDSALSLGIVGTHGAWERETAKRGTHRPGKSHVSPGDACLAWRFRAQRNPVSSR